MPGAQLRVRLDPEHWLSAGSDEEVHAIVESQRVFSPLKLDKGTNVGVYAKKDEVVGSGLVWDDVRDLLAQKAFLMHQPVGDGHVIAFAEDPNYRGYAESTELALHERGPAGTGVLITAGVRESRRRAAATSRRLPPAGPPTGP